MPAPPVDLRLAFEPPELTVAAGGEKTVMLSLPGVPENFTATVALSAASTATARVTPSTVTFTAETTSRELTVTGVSEGSAVLTAVEDILGDSDLPAGSTVTSVALEVTVVPAPIPLRLVFEPPTLTVVEGSEETVRLRLLGDVPADATLTVTLSTTDAATARVEPESVIFTAQTTSPVVTATVTVTGVSAGVGVAVRNATLTAVLDADAFADSGLPAGSTLTVVVAPAELAVTVEPPPVDLQLAFEPTELTVAAGGRATAVLRLPGVPEGAAVTVTLSLLDLPAGEAAQVLQSRLVFTAQTPNPVAMATVTVLGEVEGSAALTATADVSGLPTDSTVAPAQLSVTVVPPSVELQLAFDPPTLTVVAGAEGTMHAARPQRTVQLRLLGDVPADATVAVTLSVSDAATLQLTPESVVFDAATPNRDVAVAGLAVGNATLTAIADVSGLSMGEFAAVASAELAVTVVPARPVALQLAFEPPLLRVGVGGEATAVLSLPGVPEGAEVTVRVALPTSNPAREQATGQPSSQSVVFTAETPNRDVTVVGAAEGAATDYSVLRTQRGVTIASIAESTTLVGAIGQGFLGLGGGSSVTPALLTVLVGPLRLAFDLPRLRVVAGSEATAVLSFEGVPEGVTVPVALSVVDAEERVPSPAQVTPLVMFTAETTRQEVTVTGVVAGSVGVRAVLADCGLALPNCGLPADSIVGVGQLGVVVVLRGTFEPPELTLDVGSERTLGLSLPGVPEGAIVVVNLHNLASEVRFTPELVVFTAQAPRHEVTVLGVAEGDDVADAGRLSRRLFGFSPNVTRYGLFGFGSLSLTVGLPRVALRLAFDPPLLTVAAGAAKTATLRLSSVPLGAEVTVTLHTASTATLQVTPESVTFDMATTSREVTLTGVAEGIETLTAELDSFIGLSTVSMVAPADLTVTVVPSPVRLQLAFEPSALTLRAGATETVVLNLPGVPEGAEVTVAFLTGDAATGGVTQESVVFDAETTSRDLTVLGVAEGGVTVVAEAFEDSLDDLPPDSTVAPAELLLTVLPPLRLQLTFEPPSLALVAGATETAVLSLSGVPEGAAVTVALRTASTATARVTPESVTFTAAATSPVVTATLTLTAVAARSATLTALTTLMAFEVSRNRLSPGLIVVPANLAVTVVPPPIALQLAFDPTSLTVMLGPDARPRLSLLDMPEGTAVPVTIRLSGVPLSAVPLSDLNPRSVTFTAAAPSRELSVTPGRAGSLTLTAQADTLIGSGLPPGSSVTEAELAITVLPPTVNWQLAFDPPALTVAVESAERVELRLSGSVSVFGDGGGAVRVALTLDVETVELALDEVIFTADIRSRVVEMVGVTAGSATLRAEAVELDRFVRGVGRDVRGTGGDGRAAGSFAVGVRAAGTDGYGGCYGNGGVEPSGCAGRRRGDGGGAHVGGGGAAGDAAIAVIAGGAAIGGV